MQLCILLHDHEGVLHNEFDWEFDDKTTLRQLKEAVHLEYSIQQTKQGLFFPDGRRISGFRFDSTILQIGLKDMDEVIVKHALLPTWIAFLKQADRFEDSCNTEEKEKLFEMCRSFASELHDAAFYSTYPDFVDQRETVVRMLCRYRDGTPKAMRASIEAYFKERYAKKNPKMVFHDRQDGTRRGCICDVEVEGTIVTYHIKTQHRAETDDSCSDEDMDLKELFIYKLLEKFGVGSEIEFIPHELDSQWVVYIASREIPNFKTIEQLESNKDEDISKYAKVVTQMLFLYIVLNIGDHHLANMGVDGNGSPFIVDFFLIERPSLDVKRHLKNKVRQAEKINDFLGTFEERLQIAKNYLKESDFVRKVDETLVSFLNENKVILEKTELYFKSTETTDELHEYVKTIKENALKISEFQL